MTAEITVMNKSAVALAADSAVTLGPPGNGKIYDTVNKVFSLSKFHPVGIMIYGNAEFMKIPWETIIKMYREKLGKESFSTIQEYSDDFFKWISEEKFCSDEQQKENIFLIFLTMFNDIYENYRRELFHTIETDGKISTQKRRAKLNDILEDHLGFLRARKDSGVSSNNIMKKYEEQFRNALSVFQELNLTQSLTNKFRSYARLLLTKDYLSHRSSGIVIAGFGEDEIFPSVIEAQVDGVINGKLKSEEINNVDMARSKPDAFLIPSAQRDMVDRFMQGVDEEYSKYILYSIEELLRNYGTEIIRAHEKDPKKVQQKIQGLNATIQKQLEKFHEAANKYRYERFVDPILSVIVSLPKDELANLAEALVNLTSIKRRFSEEQETVGGPIDVAVITKGDGFVWIKRKHYFSAELNPHFINSYLEPKTRISS